MFSISTVIQALEALANVMRMMPLTTQTAEVSLHVADPGEKGLYHELDPQIAIGYQRMPFRDGEVTFPPARAYWGAIRYAVVWFPGFPPVTIHIERSATVMAGCQLTVPISFFDSDGRRMNLAEFNKKEHAVEVPHTAVTRRKYGERKIETVQRDYDDEDNNHD